MFNKTISPSHIADREAQYTKSTRLGHFGTLKCAECTKKVHLKLKIGLKQTFGTKVHFQGKIK